MSLLLVVYHLLWFVFFEAYSTLTLYLYWTNNNTDLFEAHASVENSSVIFTAIARIVERQTSKQGWRRLVKVESGQGQLFFSDSRLLKIELEHV